MSFNIIYKAVRYSFFKYLATCRQYGNRPIIIYVAFVSFLSNGITFASFNRSEKIPVLSERLIICVRRLDIIEEVCFNILGDMSLYASVSVYIDFIVSPFQFYLLGPSTWKTSVENLSILYNQVQHLVPNFAEVSVQGALSSKIWFFIKYFLSKIELMVFRCLLWLPWLSFNWFL